MSFRGQCSRTGFVLIERYEGPEGGVSRYYIGGRNDVVEAISVR